MPLGEANLFGLTQYDNKTSFFSGETLFAPGVGYAIVCGFGALFAVVTTLAMQLDKKFAGSVYHSEEFNTAGRAIKTGLSAVDVLSRATWVAALVQSSNEAYKYGIAGAFWFATGVTAQFAVFGTLALQLKRRAPKAHTVVELARRRWGHKANFVYFYLCFLNNCVICTLLILGASNLLVAATGMNEYAALMIIPFSVIVYTVTGGLKATFFSSYLHCIVIFVTLNVFCFTVYASGKEPIGSIENVWRNLTKYASVVPVEGNKDGSYLTMFSRGGVEFGILFFFSSTGVVFADQSYWQGAIAANPRASYKGYFLGSLLWLPIPFALATALGLSVRALDLPLNAAEANSGLVPMAAAQYVLGKGGAILLLIMIFMAVTSVGSAQFISMSSLFTYDIFKAYLKPKATGEQMLLVSRVAVAVSGLAMGALSCLLFKIHVDVNFLFLVMGILVGSATFPLIFMLTWAAVPEAAAVAGAVGGQVAGIIAWLVHAQSKYDELTIRFSLQQLGPSLSGTIVSMLGAALITSAWTLISPGPPDSFLSFQAIELMDGVEIVHSGRDDPKELQKLMKTTIWIGLITCGLIFILWPLLTLPAGVFSQGYFGFWVVLSMTWAIIASLVATFLPLIESRLTIMNVMKHLVRFKTMEVQPEDSRMAVASNFNLKPGVAGKK